MGLGISHKRVLTNMSAFDNAAMKTLSTVAMKRKVSTSMRSFVYQFPCCCITSDNVISKRSVLMTTKATVSKCFY